mmetsp:Transcript_52645/g.132418  ORF Transcript_52645/g.132418 Transcript_52645/m.132418 type:complete len:112 (-) Transcript_52645:1503-1838(-)
MLQMKSLDQLAMPGVETQRLLLQPAQVSLTLEALVTSVALLAAVLVVLAVLAVPPLLKVVGAAALTPVVGGGTLMGEGTDGLVVVVEEGVVALTAGPTLLIHATLRVARRS